MLDELDLLSLGTPTGNGQANAPADIAALDASLRRIDAYTPPPEYADEPQRYATEPMIRALEKFQEQNGLRIDDYANPGGPTERAINNRLLAKPQGAGLLWAPPAPLGARVGDGLGNRREDVATVQRLLGALGHMPEDPFDDPHGLIDRPTLDATKRFQRRKGLVDDGWLAPGGETERALRDAAGDIARAKGHEWLRFAERAGRAQAELIEQISARSRIPSPDESDSSSAVPVAWAGTRPTRTEPDASRESSRPQPADDDARGEPAQTAPGDWIVPWLFLTLPPLIGLGEATRQRNEKQGLPDDEGKGSKVENIPQRVPDEPFRGPDPAKPPLSSKESQPAPYPSEPPHKVPDREEIRPQELKPEDWILIDPIAPPPSPSDFILRMRGNERTQGRLTGLREIGEDVAKERTDVRLVHIGGARDDKGAKRKEIYAENPRRRELGIKTTAGAAYADLTFQDVRSGDLYHISLYRVTSGSKPRKEEVKQSIRLAINTAGETRIIVMVPNVRSDGFVDAEAFKQFLHATLDSLRDAPKVTDMSDPASRERVIRYFTQLSRK